MINITELLDKINLTNCYKWLCIETNRIHLQILRLTWRGDGVEHHSVKTNQNNCLWNKHGYLCFRSRMPIWSGVETNVLCFESSWEKLSCLFSRSGFVCEQLSAYISTVSLIEERRILSTCILTVCKTYTLVSIIMADLQFNKSYDSSVWRCSNIDDMHSFILKLLNSCAASCLWKPK